MHLNYIQWRRVLCSLLLAAPLAPTAFPGGQPNLVNVTTYHNDNARLGLNAKETALTLANVNPTQFGKLFSQAVDGFVYAQPLYLSNVMIPGKGPHNVVYVATEHDSVYAFDADGDTGVNRQALWARGFADPAAGIRPVRIEDLENGKCKNIVPEVGITGTPVIDAATGTLYVVTNATRPEKGFAQRLHALDVATGNEKFGGPVEIHASVSGGGDGSVGGQVAFDPLHNLQRPGLLLNKGVVYIAWAGHCDNGHGWLMAYDAGTLAQLAVWNATPNGGIGGIWHAGSAPAADADGSIYLATGNGTFDAATGGVDFGDSLLKFAAPTKGQMPLLDYFTPFNQADMESQDNDFGSGGPMLLPQQPAGSPHRNLLVIGDKTGTLYVVDRDNPGKFNPNGNQIVQTLTGQLACCTGGATAWWNNTVYVTSVFDKMKAFSFDPSTGRLSDVPVSQTAQVFLYYPPPFFSISSNGLTNAIVWALDPDTYVHSSSPNSSSGQSGGQPAVLRAFDARDLSREIYNSSENFPRDNAGKGVKFAVPTVVNGKVYVGTQDELAVYGLLP